MIVPTGTRGVADCARQMVENAEVMGSTESKAKHNERKRPTQRMQNPE